MTHSRLFVCAVYDKMRGRLASVFVGCNRVAGCMDWTKRNGLVAYGAHNFIAVYDMQQEKVVAVLNGHKRQVNCVRWIQWKHRDATDFEHLVTGSSDGSVCLWKWDGQIAQEIVQFQEFGSDVNAIAVHASQGEAVSASAWIVCCSSDPVVRIWRGTLESDNASHNWALVSSIPVGTCIQHCAAIAEMPSQPEHLLLALGGTDSVIRLFVCAGVDGFLPVCVLRGHQDWIRSLDLHTESESLRIASASQDRFVRVWSITSGTRSQTNPLTQLAPSMSFQSSGRRHDIKLEGLLTGHEDWVHSVQFCANEDKIQLLSASMDRTMIVWEWDSAHQCWQQVESVGDAGSSALGYFGGAFGPNGGAILAHGYTGAMHLWKKSQSDQGWQPVPSMTGHYGEVVDMCLALPHQGETQHPVSFIITVSRDRTTRILAALNGNLREIARPQVHGHDFFAVASVPDAFPDCFVTSSEEKVIRVFSAPASYHQYLTSNNLTPTPTMLTDQMTNLAYGASIKALTLTNTAVYEEDSGNQRVQEATEGVVDTYTPGPDFAPNANPCCVSGPPLEEHLSQNTLWPEIQKLYGHGDVVYSLAASPCGTFLASACKAQKEDTAVIFLWDISTWTLLRQLKGHTLTVTRMEFSPSGQYLLSGSRDRTFCLYKKDEDGYQFLLQKPKAHQRIIWDVSWAPDEVHFLTASRDQCIKLWRLPDAQCVLKIAFPDGVTAASFQPNQEGQRSGETLLACGLQNGDITVHKVDFSAETCTHEQIWMTDIHNKHSAAVHKLLWLMAAAASIQQHKCESNMLLASCSADHSLRLFELS